jgi:hypothetical protein
MTRSVGAWAMRGIVTIVMLDRKNGRIRERKESWRSSMPFSGGVKSGANKS